MLYIGLRPKMTLFTNIKNRIVNFTKRRKIWSLVILVVILIAAYFLRPKPPKPIATEKVESGTITQTVSITGTIAAENMANLSFPFAGKLNYMPFKEGDAVTTGQVVASLNTSDLQANLRQAEQDFTAAKAASERLYDSQGSSTAESFDQRVARTAVDAAQNKAYDNVVKARKAIADAALISPIDGILTHAGAGSVGVNVTVANIWTVMDLSSFEFKMEVDEADIAKVKIGDPVNINLDSYPNDTLNLAVSKIDYATHTTSSGGDAYYVTALITQAQDKYRVGMNGNADIITAKRENVLQVPFSAIQNDNEVLVKKAGGYEITKIKTGIENDTSVEVLSGLNEGDVIASDPTSVGKNLIVKSSN